MAQTLRRPQAIAPIRFRSFMLRELKFSQLSDQEVTRLERLKRHTTGFATPPQKAARNPTHPHRSSGG